VLQILHFYDPFVWLANLKIRRVREQAVDEAVLVAMGRNPAEYGDTLLAVADIARTRPTPGLGLLGVVERSNSLGSRIRHIISRPVPRHAHLGLAGLIVVLALAVMLVPMAGGRAEATKPHAEKPGAAATTAPAAAEDSEEDTFEPSGVLSGRITDEKGQPVTDARLHLRQGQKYHHSRTNVEGIYSFERVEAEGTYRLFIGSRDWVGTQGFEDEQVFLLHPHRQVVRHLKLRRGCAVSVEVVDEEGEPIPGVRLSIAPTGRDTRLNYVEDAKTDLEGIGRIGGAPSSEHPYLVTAWHDDYAYNRVLVKLIDPDHEAKAKMTLRKGIEVRGRAICSDGKPAEGWEIGATPDWWHSAYCAKTYPVDEEGYFTLKHVAPGSYTISYDIRDPQGRGSTSYPLGARKLPPPGDLLELKIPRPSLASSVEIGGTIEFAGGEPKQHFSVVARSKDGRFYNLYLPPESRAFTFGQLPRGVYELRFESTEFRQKIVPDVKAPSLDLQVRIEFTGKTVIAFAVVDAATGRPIEKFKARLRKIRTLSGPNYVPGEGWSLFDDESGKGRLEAGGPGVYEIQVAADGFAWTCSRGVNTDTEQGHECRIALTRGVTLAGKVVDEAGRPVSGAKVIPLSRAKGTMPPRNNSFVTEEPAVLTVDGRFALEHLEVGRETLKVTHPEYCFSIVEGIELKEGSGPSDLTITLRQGGTVAGHVYDEEGRPAAAVGLDIQDDFAYSGGGDETAGKLASVMTDSNGYYEVRHLPEQLCFIRRANYYQPAAGVVQHAVLPLDGEKRIIDIGGGGRITGRMMVDGKPLAGSMVQIGGASPHAGAFRSFAVTGQDGSFAFRGTPPGLRHLYYAHPAKPHDYLFAGKLQVTGKDQDVGTITNPTGVVSVTVTGSKGEADGWNVSLTEQRAGMFWGPSVGSQKPRNQPDEPFVFERIAPGEYTIMARSTNGVIIRGSITLTRQTPRESLKLEIPTGWAVLEGKISEEIRQDATLPITIWNPQRQFGYILNAGEKSTYRLETLPAGRYILTDPFNLDGKPMRKITLADGQTEKLDLDPAACGVTAGKSSSMGSLRLCVVAGNGVPVPGAEVYLDGLGGRIQPATGNDWDIYFRGPPGEYTLQASYPGLGTAGRRVHLEPGQVHGLPVAPRMLVVSLRDAP